MMYGITGVVVEKVDGGFTIRTSPGAQPLLVRTMLPGKNLGLEAGDEVSVSGGPDPRTGDWLSSTASKRLGDGRSVRVRINPDDPRDDGGENRKQE